MRDIEIRGYQTASIQSLREGFRAGHKRQILAASTGAGKSIIMMLMIEAADKKGTRSLFICERRVLVEQFSEHLDSFGVEHGVFMANHWRFRPHAKVQVASIQTLERMDAWPEVDIIFVDEIHACMRRSLIKYIEKNPNVKICGASATPFHPEIAKHFTSVTSVITMDQLIKDKKLVPFKVFAAHEVNVDGLKVLGGEWKQDDLEARGQQIVGDIVTDYIKLSHDVFGECRKSVCFSCGVAHGTELMNSFNQAGINAIQLSYKDSDDYKRDVIAEFKKPDTDIKMLISSTMLERGFDVPDIEHVILARPLKKSFSSHAQMAGRGARPYPGKEFCVIQDHSGNWLRFKDDWDNLFFNGVQNLNSNVDKKSKKEPTKKEKEAAKCPKCSHFWPAKSDICSHCGYVRTKRNEVTAKPGELIEVGSSLKVDSDYKRSFYHQLLTHCDLVGWKEGAAYHLYQKKFGVNPKWDKTREPVTPEVHRWVRSRMIAYANGKR